MSERRDVEAVTAFVREIPELQATFDKHVRDNDEVLPHVFFADVSRFAFELVRNGDNELIERLAMALETMAASGDSDAVNVIHVSFVEWFVWGDDTEKKAFERLKASFGPAMLSRVDEFDAYSAELEEAASKLRPDAEGDQT